jgi:hypothetical protein
LLRIEFNIAIENYISIALNNDTFNYVPMATSHIIVDVETQVSLHGTHALGVLTYTLSIQYIPFTCTFLLTMPFDPTVSTHRAL